MDNEWLGNYLTSMGLPPVPQKKFNGLVPPPDQMGSLSVMGTTGGGATPAPTNFKPPAPQIADAQPSQQRQGGGGTVDISEDEFRTGTPPMEIDTRSAGTSSDYSWIDTALDGALGKPEPSRYDYGAPQFNAPGGSAKRDYRNDSEIVIEDSTGPNSAGINRTVVKATQRPEFKREMADYNLGKTFEGQPRAVADLVQSVMSGRGRQQAPQQRQAPAQVLEAIAMAQKMAAEKAKARDNAFARADTSFFESSKKKERADAQSIYDEEMRAINAQMSPYRAQYPGLFGGSAPAPEAAMEAIQRKLPNVDPRLLAQFLQELASQSG